MIKVQHHGWRLILLAAIAWESAVGRASAQLPHRESMTPPSLAAVGARVSTGDVLYVTDTTGNTTRGKLAVVTDETLQVQVKDGVRSIAAAEVRRIQWRQPDSPLTGVLLGAAVGAIPGLYWLAVDPNECRGMCPEEYALIAVGAVLGGVIDRAITKKVTVYTVGEPSHPDRSVRIGPLLGQARKGVQVAVIF
jgi:hypothetical protein